jgi:hypothetical protein
MKKRDKNRFAATGLTIVSVLALGGPAVADNVKYKFEYAGRFVCGSVPSASGQLVEGEYRTALSIFNTNTKEAKIRHRVSLSYPCDFSNADCTDGSEFIGGQTSEFKEKNLGVRRAISIDCDEIPSSYNINPATPYTEGYVVIQSDRSIDVTGLITLQDTTAAGALSLQTVPERPISSSD